MLLLLLACASEVTCGPGTVLVDATCLPALSPDPGDTDSDTGTPDTSVEDTGNRDTGDSGDTGAQDTGDSGGGGTASDGWPLQFFAPYVDATSYPTVKVGEIPAETGALYYTLAFVVAAGPSSCDATWGTYYSIETGPSAWESGREYTLYEQIDLLRASGGDVMVSFGGAANTPLEAACGSVEEVVAQYERVIDQLGLTRVDFDIEGPWMLDAASLTRRSQAIALLQSRRPELKVWYTLPVLPSGLTPEGVRLVQDALDHGVRLDGVNVMTMNYGDGTAPNPSGQMGEYGIEAITSLHAQLDAVYGGGKTEAELWSMIGTTPMIGHNDVATELFDLEDARQTLAFVREKGVSMLSMWSINRDHPCETAVEWAQPGCNGLTDVEDWAYARAFSGR